MPDGDGYLKRFGDDVDKVVHRLADEVSVVLAHLDFLESEAVLNGEQGQALKDAAAMARRMMATVRALQALVG
jgi:hypothetical protein